jgi:hypothetical protein
MSHTNYHRPNPERVRRIQELRRSNAAQPIRNKRKYTRKAKYAGKWE